MLVERHNQPAVAYKPGSRERNILFLLLPLVLPVAELTGSLMARQRVGTVLNVSIQGTQIRVKKVKIGHAGAKRECSTGWSSSLVV